jgi:hypothetical protein
MDEDEKKGEDTQKEGNDAPPELYTDVDGEDTAVAEAPQKDDTTPMPDKLVNLNDLPPEVAKMFQDKPLERKAQETRIKELEELRDSGKFSTTLTEKVRVACKKVDSMSARIDVISRACVIGCAILTGINFKGGDISYGVIMAILTLCWTNNSLRIDKTTLVKTLGRGFRDTIKNLTHIG